MELEQSQLPAEAAVDNGRRSAVLALASAAFLAACGGGADRTKARLRLVNVSGYSGLDLTVDDDLLFSAVGYGQGASYEEINPGSPASTLASTGSATTLLSFTPAVSKNRAYTLLAYGAQGALQQVLLDENSVDPDSGKAFLRVINAAPDAGALDVYVTGSGDSLDSSVPLQANAAAGTVGSYVTVNSATWRVRVTGAGRTTDLRLDLAALGLSSKQVATLVLTAGSAGVLVNALLLTEEGPVDRHDNTQARVRVAAVVTDSGAVTATVAGTTLLADGALAVTEYGLVPAGTVEVSVAVNGAASSSSTTLAAGADYTLMVWGTPQAPDLSWLLDDNLPPKASSSSRLRLVHGLADLASTLSLTSDFLPVAQGVQPGTASTPLTLSANAAASFTVTTPGQTSAVLTAIDQVLVDGGVYTLFVVGRAAQAVGILRQDR